MCAATSILQTFWKNPTLVSGGPDAPKLWMATTKAHQVYSDVKIGPDDYIMFGKESAGIPEEILVEYEKSCIRIPMGKDIRSLNLSNSVAIVCMKRCARIIS